MPASHNPLSAAQDSSCVNNENAAVHTAYRLIAQLRRDVPELPPLPKVTLNSRDWQEADPEVQSVRAAGF